MKSMFIVSVDNGTNEVTAEGLRTTLSQKWGGYSGVKFNVEEGDHKTIASFVSDYLTAEDALSKYEAAHDIYGGKTDLLTTPPTGIAFMTMSRRKGYFSSASFVNMDALYRLIDN